MYTCIPADLLRNLTACEVGPDGLDQRRLLPDGIDEGLKFATAPSLTHIRRVFTTSLFVQEFNSPLLEIGIQ